jgi:ABC-type oligopeptide transport system substrate-binding subunit
MPGFRDAHIYPLDRPDLARARSLAGPGRRTAVLYTTDRPDDLKRAQILSRNLAAIGIDVQIDTFPGFAALYKKETTKGEPWDIATNGWFTDGYFDPYDFLNILLDGDLGSGANISHFDDPAYNRRLEAAAKLTGAARYTAYARLDADLARNAAPLIAWGIPTRQEFFSARMGCQQPFGPHFIDLAALCIRR